MMKRFKFGFSLAELMVVLVLVSLLITALIPIITKKHLALPKLSEHGAYMCYYQAYDANNNPIKFVDKTEGLAGDEVNLNVASTLSKIKKWQLHEKQTNNPFGSITSVNVFDRDVKQCSFTPPKKAVYFQVSAVGGGGGGGDSGYHGGSIHSGWTDLHQIPALGLTEEKMRDFRVIASNWKDGKTHAYFPATQKEGETIQSDTNLAAEFYPFVKGAYGGNGGPITLSNIYQCCPENGCKQTVKKKYNLVPELGCKPSCICNNKADCANLLGVDQNAIDNIVSFQTCSWSSPKFSDTGEEDFCQCDYEEIVKVKDEQNDVPYNDTCTKYIESGYEYCCALNGVCHGGGYTSSAPSQSECAAISPGGYTVHSHIKLIPYSYSCTKTKDIPAVYDTKCDPKKQHPSDSFCIDEGEYGYFKHTKYSDSATASPLTGAYSCCTIKDHNYYSKLVNNSEGYQACIAENDAIRAYNEKVNQLNIFLAGNHTQDEIDNKIKELGLDQEPVRTADLVNDPYGYDLCHYTETFNNVAGLGGRGAVCIPKKNTPVTTNEGYIPKSTPYNIAWINGGSTNNGATGASFEAPRQSYSTIAISSSDGYDAQDNDFFSKLSRGETEYLAKIGSSAQGGKGVKFNKISVNNGIDAPNATENVYVDFNSHSSYEDTSSTRFDIGGNNAEGSYNKRVPSGMFYVKPVMGENGVDGACSSDSRRVAWNLPSQESDICNSSGINSGYCMIHNKEYYTSYSTYDSSSRISVPREETGYELYTPVYNHRHSYDENYLTYGNPGSAGEIKTVVVRSLDNMDLSINIGVGGVEGLKGSGLAGKDGSATSFGRIIHAEGGKGGQGNLVASNTQMQPFDKNEWDRQRICASSNQKTIDGKTWEDLKDSLFGGKTCDEYYENGKFLYINKPGGIVSGEAQLKGFATNLYNFIFGKKQDAYTQLFHHYGRGGVGGGVNHKCWAGQFIVWFEGNYLNNVSVFPSGGKWKRPTNLPYVSGYTDNDGSTSSSDSTIGITPSGAMEVDNRCHADFDIIEAGKGMDGALLIKW